MKLRAPQRILLDPIHPNVGVAVWYQHELLRLLKAMTWDVQTTMLNCYPKDLTQDAPITKTIESNIAELAKRWQRIFDHAAQTLPSTLTGRILRHHDLAFRTVLDKAGFSVRFQMTPTMVEAMDEKVRDNVDLIKSIPRQHLDEVEAMTRESISKGRNMKEYTEQLQHRFGVAKKRAELIARDQNNKASALFHKVRQLGLGLDKAAWAHTAASKVPRPEHEEWGAEEKVYDVAQGMWSDEDGEFVWPGTAINCGCTDRTIIPGYDDEEGQNLPDFAETVSQEE